MDPERPARAALDRRGFLAGAGAALASLAAGPFAAALAESPDAPRFLAAAGEGEGYAALVLDAGLKPQARAASAQRLHGFDAQGGRAVAVGRRPGHVALVLDPLTGRGLGDFAPAPGRVFSGHGRFSPDGTVFLANEIERPEGGRGMGRGTVSLRRPDAGFAIEAEWPSGGDGPHDLFFAPFGLVVANGGIEPNTPEAKDAERAGSSLAVLDPQTGAARAEGRLAEPLASLSLRHLALSREGALAVAAQDLLADGEARPLLFRVSAAGALTAFEAPDAEWRALRGYVGSLAYDRSGRYLACASPRGGRVSVFRAEGRFVGAVPLADGCALAPAGAPGRFVAGGGYGQTLLIGVEDERVGVLARGAGGPRFDNHFLALR
ncbi:DUF1513 domain-containing protein [Methylocella sp.]|uniref:DUF1513 domain-containing protein n=1 Tax=Methylocella sp. TaxID=1978226 RepID=UPI003782D53C